MTDPFVGFVVDKTNTKFGKNRPFIVVGQIILFVSSFILFNVTPSIPKAGRFPFFGCSLYGLYHRIYLPVCCYKISAVLLDKRSKQRPIFAMFDSVYNVVATDN